MTDMGTNYRRSFTIVELLVASVVMATALLGVYGIFQEAMETERTTGMKWNDCAAANAVLTHLADSLEQIVNLPNIPAIAAEPKDGDGQYIFTCSVMNNSLIERRHYVWNLGGQGDAAGTMELKKMYFAGSQNITPVNGIKELSEEEAWDKIEPEIIAQNLKAVSFLFKPADDPAANWNDRWSGPAGKVIICVRVSSGDQTVEMMVVPKANTQVVAASGNP